jgi:hypothetical protein
MEERIGAKWKLPQDSSLTDKTLHFLAVEYPHLYSGIDWVFRINQQFLESDLVIHPGADARRIRMNLGGGFVSRNSQSSSQSSFHWSALMPANLKIDPQGNLVIQSSDWEIRVGFPCAYQEERQGFHSIPSYYRLLKG